MAPAWRRLLVPLALSLVGHALVLYAVGLVPRHEVGAPHAVRESSPLRLSLSITGPRRSATKPIEPEGVWIDVQPALVIPPTPSGGSIGPSLAPTLSPGGAENGLGSGVAARPAGSSFVVVPKEARRVVFLLDSSGSMGISDALERAKAELAAALAALPPETSFQLLAYNSNARPLMGGLWNLLPASRENVALALHQLDALAASGVTRHVEAMRAALLLRPDLVILLTDADDLSPGDVHLMTKANRGRAVIDIVELTRDPLPQPDGGLASLATLNQGRHRRVLLGRVEGVSLSR
jgi:von Willebrand factor type A domain